MIQIVRMMSTSTARWTRAGIDLRSHCAHFPLLFSVLIIYSGVYVYSNTGRCSLGPSFLCFHRRRMALALARALLSSTSLAPSEGRLGDGRATPRTGGSARSERSAAAARSLTAFACRLDVILVSAVFLVMVVVPVMVLACLP